MPSEYEREIDEILRRMGDLGPSRSAGERFLDGVRARRRSVQLWFRNAVGAAAPDQLMVTAILLFVAAFFMRFISQPLAFWVGLAGFALFVASFALSFQHLWGGKSKQVRWRGRVINLREGQPTLADRLVLWFRRQFDPRH